MAKMRSRAQDIQDAIDDMTDTQIVANLKAVLDDPQYMENDFTALVESICAQFVERKTISGKQRQVLSAHMNFNARFWF